MNKVVLFTGAGIGVPMGLPTTTQFAEIIDRHCVDNFKLVLQSYLGGEFYDIEKILSTLEFFVHNKSFLKHIIKTSSKVNGALHHPHFQTVDNSINEFQQAARTLIFEIKSSLFRILNKYDKDKALQLYMSILDELLIIYKQPAISFFTTNYDLTFDDLQDDLESFYEEKGIKAVNNGFTYRNRLFFDITNQYSWDNTIIEYKKLHGSLDWITSGNKIIKAGGNINPSDPDQMLLLYPGYKGTPNNEPYKSFHDDLLQRLLTADAVYIIGFAFRDDYINNQFDTALKINNKLQVYCYNPSTRSNLPKESKLSFFADKYSDRFKHIEIAIDVPENPFDLILNSQSHAGALITRRATDALETVANSINAIKKNSKAK